MAVYELKNELLCVTIDSHGAELKSLKRNHDNQEYMLPTTYSRKETKTERKEVNHLWN